MRESQFEEPRMRAPQFEELRAYADDAVRQPGFADIRRRARRVRRRRTAASSAAAAVAVLVVTGLGYVATTGSRGGSPVAVPTPATSAADTGWPRVTSVAATGSKDLYAVVERCRECGPQLYASPDAGATWQRRPVPPAPDTSDTSGDVRTALIVELGNGILAWKERRSIKLEDLRTSPSGTTDGGRGPSANQGLWITVDGGRTWRRAAIDPEPVAAVLPGTRPVDCGLLGPASPCRIYAVNPVSGRFAPLADQPPGITVESGWAGQTSVPLSAGLWVPGLDPATRKPAVAASSDGGRTWRTRVFTDGVAAEAHDGMIATMYLPTVAAGPNGTAYVLTYRADLRKDTHRTTDGGASWVSGDSVPEVPDAGFVTADGGHVVNTGQGFLADRDGGGGYAAVTLPGFPAELRRQVPIVSHPAAGRYLLALSPGLLLSDDGWKWRRVDTP
ncbi:hypothetical protein DMB66_41780 [Actinoplanes sp. ATCC 53533]|uniref:hypothetical protein n=1 Tax=Actinoplanes sp. ATCC 53533 TaxID=1288362 RepID=UPI000F78B552|nr:hypothetical protein [Actinoplanes sp. ATCC 53533]RSM51496.1 hypothetical protein DMB66_41780 [Actinoplanes sp. ATCC 53533]